MSSGMSPELDMESGTGRDIHVYDGCWKYGSDASKRYPYNGSYYMQ